MVGQSGKRRADHGAVERPGGVELVGHRQAAGAGLVLDDDARLARNMVGKMARQEARIGVVSRPDPDAHHETHRLAAIEGGDVLLCERRRTGGQQREGGEEGEGAFHHWLWLTSLHQPRRGHRNPSCMSQR
jgi:hypothetical protein